MAANALIGTTTPFGCPVVSRQELGTPNRLRCVKRPPKPYVAGLKLAAVAFDRDEMRGNALQHADLRSIDRICHERRRPALFETISDCLLPKRGEERDMHRADPPDREHGND